MSAEDKKIIIAIDGFSSTGKSTMAKQLARTIGYRYIDSGAMYRAVTLYAIRHGMTDPAVGKVDESAIVASLPEMKIDFAVNGDGSQSTLLNGENVEKEIRGMAVSQFVSEVAAIPAVRHALVDLQAAMGKEKGIVMDGRDIGTTVFPDAEMKVYVNASAQTRAQRRLDEMIGKGISTTFEEVLANVIHRDHIDLTRAESPLRRADDAVELDNSQMTEEEQDRWLLNLFRRVVEK